MSDQDWGFLFQSLNFNWKSFKNFFIVPHVHSAAFFALQILAVAKQLFVPETVRAIRKMSGFTIFMTCKTQNWDWKLVQFSKVSTIESWNFWVLSSSVNKFWWQNLNKIFKMIFYFLLKWKWFNLISICLYFLLIFSLW